MRSQPAASICCLAPIRLPGWRARSVTLRMTLLEITPVADGAHATLHIQGESRDPLPAFSATVEYGQLQGTTENYQEVNAQSLLVNAPASLRAPSDVNISLPLKGITPAQLGFIRIHDIQPVNQ